MAAAGLYAKPAKKGSAVGGFDLGGYYEKSVIEVWPENWPSAEIFIMVGTQWRVGVGGATGLHYDVVYELIGRKGYAGDDWWRVFYDIRFMEREALTAMHED